MDCFLLLFLVIQTLNNAVNNLEHQNLYIMNKINDDLIFRKHISLGFHCLEYYRPEFMTLTQH